ncbi:hypothetical protein GN244_ATG14575 [Phytophthora infestans]|uniref:Uncharacterized protein n=1 Tax=Phytophthora infestans TaxID=4787 RepID=A0A833W8B6_PHYIN|nr:hypothetical protein GN244_ATG14575 [Phytophthora infestans]KAF4147123.1 hypothetical protein GN958_ATG03752 [Phytophthora infestans]
MNGSRYPAATRDFDGPGVPSRACNNAARVATPAAASTGFPSSLSLIQPNTTNGGCGVHIAPNVSAQAAIGNWRQEGDEMKRLRSRHVILIERMLRNHQPHDVLTQVPENYDWHSKTFTLAIKIERLMFTTATSRDNYLDESTLRQRIQLLSRHLVRLRKRKNAMAVSSGTRV